jgi:hypothetical protein
MANGLEEKGYEIMVVWCVGYWIFNKTPSVSPSKVYHDSDVKNKGIYWGDGG